MMEGNATQICLAKEIQKGVIVGNCIVKPTKNIGVIRVINTREMDINLSEVNLEFQPLENYNIMNFDSNIITEERLKKILEKIDLTHLNSEETEGIVDILDKYKDIFYLENDKLTYTTTIKHSIDIMTNTKPINSKPYRLPMLQRQEINKQIGQMLEENIISRTNSAWNSPLLLVPKKSTTDQKAFRLVIDYRKLNEVSIGDCFPFVSVSDILDNLG